VEEEQRHVKSETGFDQLRSQLYCKRQHIRCRGRLRERIGFPKSCGKSGIKRLPADSICRSVGKWNSGVVCGPHGWLPIQRDHAGRQTVSISNKGMLCLADRYFLGYEIWISAKAAGADLLWRGRKNLCLDVGKRLPDGSYLSRIYVGTLDWRRKCAGDSSLTALSPWYIDYCAWRLHGFSS
jgi:hypothetical protein